MDLSAAESALDRTALLLATDVHQGRATKRDVIDGLLGTHVVIRAVESELQSAASQHAVVTLALHLAMCGMGVFLDLPDVELATPQPPLAGSHLRSALVAHIAATFPWVDLGCVEQHALRFVVGATPSLHAEDVVIAGTQSQICVGATCEVEPRSWMGDWPIAPIAAGIAGASHAVRVASLRTARMLGIDPPLLAGGRTDINVPGVPMRATDLGLVPVISAGAITHAAVYALLRVPRLAATLKPYDDDEYESPNLNRYSLLIQSDLGAPKGTSLDRWSTDRFRIRGTPCRYEGGEEAGSSRTLVGADDIPVRWAAQDDTAGWLGIGATSHLFAEISTHVPGSPCSGCVHDHEDQAPSVIPTISVISGWAGLHLANELLQSATDPQRATLIWSSPLGLSGPNGHTTLRPAPSDRCPRRCPLSRRTA